jgi:capsular polysaccharide transport system ATP-binding protein
MMKLENVTKIYGTRTGSNKVLNDINFEIKKGEKIGILGGNGAGKSTLIRIIAQAEQPTFGKVTHGMSVSWPLAFGGAFQGSLTGYDNIRFICRVYNTDIKNTIEYVKEFTELGKYLNEPVKNYSSGMRAKLAFAISMSVEFDCYLIDEVIAVGDAKFQEKCRQELFEKRKDRSLILVSHIVSNIKKYCEKVCVLENGVLHRFMDIDSGYNYYEKVI